MLLTKLSIPSPKYLDTHWDCMRRLVLPKALGIKFSVPSPYSTLFYCAVRQCYCPSCPSHHPSTLLWYTMGLHGTSCAIQQINLLSKLSIPSLKYLIDVLCCPCPSCLLQCNGTVTCAFQQINFMTKLSIPSTQVPSYTIPCHGTAWDILCNEVITVQVLSEIESVPTHKY